MKRGTIFISHSAKGKGGVTLNIYTG